MPAETPGPKFPRREVWVDVGAEYPDFKFKIWVNYPAGWDQLLFEDDPAKNKADELLPQIVLEHNGWRDFEGKELPPASDPAFWQYIPGELVAFMLVAIQQEKVRLPLSRLQPRRR